MKTKNTPPAEPDLKNKIQTGYIDFILTEGKNPESVYHFCKIQGIQEADFYKHYSSFDSIETSVWEETLSGVLHKLEKNKDYAGFGVREKLLSFFFALTEEMRSQRSFFIRSSANWFIPGKASAAKNALEQEVKPFFEKLVAEGFQTGELADRAKISDYYPQAMIVQFWFIIQFWMTDESRDFEDTDAAIEKGVNLGFDLMKENTLDKAFDLAKFLWGRAKTR